ncbi:hypothetical protein XENOCAPTIV_030434 [Xenoophorus captivus]|uniref:Uncharacterized protein n=1 Tax=Xenoophorus captivus TaxID=1517983 RepID=A0ABV0REP5_9TELE
MTRTHRAGRMALTSREMLSLIGSACLWLPLFAEVRKGYLILSDDDEVDFLHPNMAWFFYGLLFFVLYIRRQNSIVSLTGGSFNPDFKQIRLQFISLCLPLQKVVCVFAWPCSGRSCETSQQITAIIKPRD